MRKFSEGPALSIGPFQKAAINCSKIVAYMVKIVNFLVSIVFEHSQKAISLVFETETVGSCLIQKLRCGGRGRGGGHGPLSS